MSQRAALPWVAAGGAAVAVAVVAGVLALVLSGEPAVSTRTDDLIRRVATHGDVSDGLLAIDLAAVRRTLDLPEDADPRAGFGSGDEAERRLLGTSVVTPFLHSPAAQDLREAIDLGRVQAAARTLRESGDGALLVIRTGQPVDEIAMSLRNAGWTRHEDVLSRPEGGSRHRWPRAALGDGLLALGRDAGVVRRAVGAPARTTPFATVASALLRDTESFGVALRDVTDDPCVARWAVVDRYDGSGEVVLFAAGDIEAIGVALDQRRLARWDVVRAAVDSDQVSVRLDAGPFGVTPLQLATHGLPNSEIWDCDATSGR